MGQSSDVVGVTMSDDHEVERFEVDTLCSGIRCKDFAVITCIG